MSDETQKLKQDAEALLTQHLPMLKGYVRHLLSSPEDADDLTQEICVEALKNPDILFRGSEPAAYLRGIARHLASRHLRRASRHALIEDFIDLAWEAPEEKPDRQQEQSALKKCLEKLPDRLRCMVLWRYDDGMNSTQIAERFNMSSDGVRMALARARQTLSKCIRQRTDAAGENG
jgi:RNA polymerase sigma-70 factor, ECF subfamily